MKSGNVCYRLSRSKFFVTTPPNGKNKLQGLKARHFRQSRRQEFVSDGFIDGFQNGTSSFFYCKKRMRKVSLHH